MAAISRSRAPKPKRMQKGSENGAIAAGKRHERCSQIFNHANPAGTTMTILEAHEHFAARTDRSDCPVVARIDDMDAWPAYATACASLSGLLADCRTDAQLNDAIRHYAAIVDIEAEPPEQLVKETYLVLAELMAWGDRSPLAMGNERN